MNDQVHDAPALRQRIEKQTELVGKWEDARRVPDQKRLTWFYPDFGCYVLNYYVTAERLDAAAKEVERQKALAAERPVSYTHLPSPRDRQKSRMPSSA